MENPSITHTEFIYDFPLDHLHEKRSGKATLLVATSCIYLVATSTLFLLHLHEMATTGESENFFEGAEKLLEVWFGSSRALDNKADLRRITR